MNSAKANSSFDSFINSESYQNLRTILESISSIALKVTEQIKPLDESMKSLKAMLPDYSDTFKHMQEVVRAIEDMISKQLDNPDSWLSYYNYFKALSNFFWVMPYKVTSNHIKELIKKENTEEEFDRFMLNYFTDSLLEELFCDIKSTLPSNHMILFEQCVGSFRNKEYALCSLGLYSIIDDVLSFYILNKGCVSRKGIFGPIVREMAERDDFGKNHTMDFILLMMDKNIDSLYESTDFNTKVSITKNKDTNRNYSVHGKYYSNKRESDLMLFNSLFWLLKLQSYLSKYKNSLAYEKKQFKYIGSSQKNATL